MTISDAGSVRLVVYLGTRACPSALDAAMADHPDAVRVLVPADPALAGPLAEADGVPEGLAEVGAILSTRAREQAAERARERDAPYADVFDQAPEDPGGEVAVDVLEGPLVEGLERALEEREVDACYVARDALDVLDGAGVRLTEALEDHPAGIVAP